MKRLILFLCVAGLCGLTACQNNQESNADAPETSTAAQTQTAGTEGEGEGEGGGAPAPPITIRQELAGVMEKRLESYRAQLTDLASDKTLGESRTMDMVERYFTTLDPAQMNSQYIGTATVLLSNMKRANPQRKEKLNTLLSLSTYVFLDNLVASDATELHRAHSEILQTVSSLMKDQGLDAKDLLAKWNPEPLSAGSGAQVVQQIRKLF